MNWRRVSSLFMNYVLSPDLKTSRTQRWARPDDMVKENRRGKGRKRLAEAESRVWETKATGGWKHWIPPTGWAELRTGVQRARNTEQVGPERKCYSDKEKESLFSLVLGSSLVRTPLCVGVVLCCAVSWSHRKRCFTVRGCNFPPETQEVRAGQRALLHSSLGGTHRLSSPEAAVCKASRQSVVNSRQSPSESLNGTGFVFLWCDLKHTFWLVLLCPQTPFPSIPPGDVFPARNEHPMVGWPVSSVVTWMFQCSCVRVTPLRAEYVLFASVFEVLEVKDTERNGGECYCHWAAEKDKDM